jgi:hypothetical protein
MVEPDLQELDLLLGRLCDGLLDDDRGAAARLISLLDKSAVCRHRYIETLDLHAVLWSVGGDSASPSELMPANGTTASCNTACPQPFRMAISFPSLFHSTLTYFSDGMPLAYLGAAVITGLALLIMGLVHVSGPEEVAKHTVAPVVEPKEDYVGRITGVAGTKWAEGPSVRLGQKFDLPSGLMEITYNTGAKVILQGPVTYEVESNGGFLSIGKLTGRLATRNDEARMTNDERNHEIRMTKRDRMQNSSFVIRPSSFVIHTPTAAVTDLGTEFGVEVGNDGITETCVFTGQVVVTMSGRAGGDQPHRQVIHAGQSVRVEQGRELSVTERSSAERSGRFTRVLPSRAPSADTYAEMVLSMNPVVYYRMEEFLPGKDRDSYVLVDFAPGRHHGKGYTDHGYGPRSSGRFGGGLELHESAGEYAIVPDYPKADSDQLSVAVWVWATTLSSSANIVGNWLHGTPEGQNSTGQFYIAVTGDLNLAANVRDRNSRDIGVFDGQRLPYNVFPRNQWQHVAFVADGKMLHLYRNGIEVGTHTCEGIVHQPPTKELAIGCRMDDRGAVDRADKSFLFWDGRLDELAVFNHALSPEQVRRLALASDVFTRNSIGRKSP